MSDCKFESGKTYKTRDGRDALVIATPDMLTKSNIDEQLWAIIDGVMKSYCADGLMDTHGTCGSDLVQPLKKVLGGIYEDNKGIFRVLVHRDNQSYAYSIYPTEHSGDFMLDTKDWTKHYCGHFYLVELVNDPGNLI